MHTVSFHTLGCKLNYAETGTLGREFERRDFKVVGFGEPADVTVINTCSVTEEADRKCRQTIRRALRDNPDTFVIVTGCYAQLRPDAARSIPGVDWVLGSREKFRLFEHIRSFTKEERTQVEVGCIDDNVSFPQAYAAGERTRAFLKIQDGCDYSCAFCTIPAARGRSRSATIASVIGQAEEIAAAGFREIVLSGINIGLFGGDTGESLGDLFHELDRVDGVERYRISSIEPNLLTDELIDFVASSRAFMPHFHMPLQSGDDFVLGKMRRRYVGSLYRERFERIRETMPEACIGVDVIVGFPAETEERFQNSFEFLSGLDVSYLHVFTYSERPGTIAVDELCRMGGSTVPKQERTRRNRILRGLSQKMSGSFYSGFLGSVRPVLWESDRHGGRMAGFTDNYIRVEAPFEVDVIGTIQRVRLSEITCTGNVEAELPDFVSVL